MPKIKIEKDLFDRIQEYVESVGYSSVDEFVAHCLEKEVEISGETENDETVTNRLKGLGYLE